MFKNWKQSTKDTLFDFDGKVHTCTCNPITYNTEGWFACFFYFCLFCFLFYKLTYMCTTLKDCIFTSNSFTLWKYTRRTWCLEGGRGDCNQNTKILIKNSALSINIAPFSVIIIILDILVSRTWLIRKEIATDIFSKIILLFNTLINLLMLVHSSAGLRIRKISNFTCMYVCHERQFVALNIHALRHLWSWKKCTCVFS